MQNPHMKLFELCQPFFVAQITKGIKYSNLVCRNVDCQAKFKANSANNKNFLGKLSTS